MESILQGLQDLDGVLGALAIGPAGQIVGFRAHAVYNQELLQQVASVVTTALDSVQLLHEDWEAMTVTFGDGRILVRNLSSITGRGSLKALALIAEDRLNLSFAGVALRVAAMKLKSGVPAPSQGLAGPPGPASAPTPASTTQMSPSAQRGAAPSIADFGHSSRPEVAGSGLSWSGLGGSTAMTASGVPVADVNSATYLTGCTKALARSVGPMAGTFVKEAIRRLWPTTPFSREMGHTLLRELERHIDDGAELKDFRTAVRSL